MKKTVLAGIIFVITLSFGAYKFFLTQRSAVSGLKIDARPSASVFIDDMLAGTTPFDQKYPPGEYTIKLIPDDPSTQASSWQGTVTLRPSILTYINRDLGTSELTSAGEILSLEKIDSSDAQIDVTSQPDGATVLLDGQEKGISPMIIYDVPPGEHDIALHATGMTGRTVRVAASSGHKLNTNFQLALSDASLAGKADGGTVAGEQAPEEEKKPQILILDTPTGFLRVRSEANTASKELTQVKPGEKYLLIEEEKGWYKILYEGENEGWISGRYAEKIE